MSTLTSQPLASLLECLFIQADQANARGMPDIAPAELDRLLHSRTDYLDLYRRVKDLWLPVSRETGALLYMLTHLSQARTIVEYGTSFGISTLYLAAGLRDNGGGHLIATEFEPAKIRRARQHLVEAGLDDLVELREGDALQTLSAGLPPSIDLVLLDGAKALYGDILDLLEPRLRPGALVIADNADDSEGYLERMREPGSGYLSLAFADDVEVSMRQD